MPRQPKFREEPESAEPGGNVHVRGKYKGVAYSIVRLAKSPYLYARFQWEGQTRLVSTKIKKDEERAEDEARKAIDAFRLGVSSTKHLDFVYCTAKYLEHAKLQLKSEKNYLNYVRCFGHINEYFKGRTISDIKYKDITDYVIWMKSYFDKHKVTRIYHIHGKNYKKGYHKPPKNSVLNRHVTLIYAMLSFHRKSYGESVVPKLDTWVRLRENKGKNVLTPTQFAQVIEYYNNHNKRYYAQIIRFLAASMVRFPSELFAIKWRNVCLEPGQETLEIVGRKSKANKQVDSLIPLFGDGLAVIKELKERLNIPKGEDDLVFVNDKGVQVKSLHYSFKATLKRLGIDDSICLYSMRSYGIQQTILTRPEIHISVLKRIVGHSPGSKQIETAYAHLLQSKFFGVFKDSDKAREKAADLKGFEALITSKGLEAVLASGEFQAFAQGWQIRQREQAQAQAEGRHIVIDADKLIDNVFDGLESEISNEMDKGLEALKQKMDGQD